MQITHFVKCQYQNRNASENKFYWLSLFLFIFLENLSPFQHSILCPLPSSLCIVEVDSYWLQLPPNTLSYGAKPSSEVGKKKLFTLCKQIISRLDFNQTVLSRTLVMRPLKRFWNHNKVINVLLWDVFLHQVSKKRERERRNYGSKEDRQGERRNGKKGV